MVSVSSWLAAGFHKHVVQCSSIEDLFRLTTKSICIKCSIRNAQIMFLCIVALLKRYREILTFYTWLSTGVQRRYLYKINLSFLYS